MTARQVPRRVQAQRLQAAFRAQAKQRAQRDREAFEAALADLLDRIATQPPPPPPAPASSPPPVVRPRSDVVRVPEPEVWWSPTPVLGYRLWELHDGGLHGAWTRWTIPRKTAVCLDKQSRATGPVPHDARECRHPPCGIYALREPGPAARTMARSLRTARLPLTVAMGLVAMSGRVVEHEHGYRAEHVEVVSLAMVTGASGKFCVLVTVDDRDGIHQAFVEPSRTRSTRDPQLFGLDDAVNRAVAHLRRQAEPGATA